MRLPPFTSPTTSCRANRAGIPADSEPPGLIYRNLYTFALDPSVIVLHEEIEVARPRHEAFAYVRDFTTAPEWDHTTRSALQITPGPPEIGSVFELKCALPVGHITLQYTITRLEAPTLLELQGRSALFEVTDLIQFRDTATGTHLSYQATFNFQGPFKGLESSLEEGMQRMGRSSVAGLREALQDQFPVPAASTGTRRADHWLLPGIAMFTTRGYRRGRKRWHPVSAWMGDKHAVITGASSGIGLAAARALARCGTRLTLVVRDESRGAALARELRQETGNGNIRIELADLSLMSDVDRLVTRLKQRGDAIDVLINNAGALFTTWDRTSEGLEQSFALLTLSPYRLTLGLKPQLRAAQGARVINVVSGGMYTQRLEVERLQADPENYSGSVAYARAKRALMVLTEQWAQAWADEGIVVNAMHPGWADTPGVEKSLPGFHRLTRPLLRSPEQGADTVVWLARATEAGTVSGKLFLDREPRPAHLLASTRETNEERVALQHYLEQISDTFEAERTSGHDGRLAATHPV